MLFEAPRHRVNVLPLKSRFVEAGLRSDIVRDIRQPVALKNGKGAGLDRLKGGLRRVVGEKELEHVPSFGQVLIARDALCVDLLLGCRFRFIGILLDQVDEAGEQIVVEAVVAVEGETEQVE